MNTLKYKVEHGVFQSQCCEINAECNCAFVSAGIEPGVQRTGDQALSLLKCAQCFILHKAVMAFKLRSLCFLWPHHPLLHIVYIRV